MGSVHVFILAGGPEATADAMVCGSLLLCGPWARVTCSSVHAFVQTGALGSVLMRCHMVNYCCAAPGCLEPRWQVPLWPADQYVHGGSLLVPWATWKTAAVQPMGASIRRLSPRKCVHARGFWTPSVQRVSQATGIAGTWCLCQCPLPWYTLRPGQRPAPYYMFWHNVCAQEKRGPTHLPFYLAWRCRPAWQTRADLWLLCLGSLKDFPSPAH